MWSGVAVEMPMKFVTPASRLYEQERVNHKGSPQLGL